MRVQLLLNVTQRLEKYPELHCLPSGQRIKSWHESQMDVDTMTTSAMYTTLS